MTLKPIIKLDRPVRTFPPVDIIKWIDHEHPAARMLAFLCRSHPTPFDREHLMRAYMSDVEGHRAGVFEWRIMRINDSLPMAGWEVWKTPSGSYGLAPISETRFQRLFARAELRVQRA